jgi:hypothetical protein
MWEVSWTGLQNRSPDTAEVERWQARLQRHQRGE